MRTPSRPLLVGRRCLFTGRGTPAVSRPCGNSWRLPAVPADTQREQTELRAVQLAASAVADLTLPARGAAGRGSEISAWRAVSLGPGRTGREIAIRVRHARPVAYETQQPGSRVRPIRSVGPPARGVGCTGPSGPSPEAAGWAGSAPSARQIRRRVYLLGGRGMG